jgi:hypothetical protein
MEQLREEILLHTPLIASLANIIIGMSCDNCVTILTLRGPEQGDCEVRIRRCVRCIHVPCVGPMQHMSALEGLRGETFSDHDRIDYLPLGQSYVWCTWRTGTRDEEEPTRLQLVSVKRELSIGDALRTIDLRISQSTDVRDNSFALKVRTHRYPLSLEAARTAEQWFYQEPGGPRAITMQPVWHHYLNNPLISAFRGPAELHLGNEAWQARVTRDNPSLFTLADTDAGTGTTRKRKARSPPPSST